MNLRESLDPEYGESVPDKRVLSSREAWMFFLALSKGYAYGAGIELAASTNGRTMRLHDLSNDTRSPKIARERDYTEGEVLSVFLSQIGHLSVWEPESDEWGPEPLDDPDTEIRRTSEE